EPTLGQDGKPEELAAFRAAYETLAAKRGQAKLIVQTYFSHVGTSYASLSALPVAGIGLDFVRGRTENLALLRQYGFPEDKLLVAGVVDGRNVWRSDLEKVLALTEEVAATVPSDRLLIAPSSSLLHVPYDASREDAIDPEIRRWLAFAEQKLVEVVTLGHALHDGRDSVQDALRESTAIAAERATSARVHNPAVQARAAHAADERRAPYAERRSLQDQRLGLPPLPTTTVGSFPQTAEVRRLRRLFEDGSMSQDEYDSFIEQSIADAITRQEDLGLDVLVHGEFESNYLVQFFGEQLAGFAFTHHGWVQSYGSRCVRPPIIVGDVARPGPMTVRWSTYAQSLTHKPVKGMLTGPVTILNWSFVRD